MLTGTVEVVGRDGRGGGMPAEDPVGTGAEKEKGVGIGANEKTDEVRAGVEKVAKVEGGTQDDIGGVAHATEGREVKLVETSVVDVVTGMAWGDMSIGLQSSDVILHTYRRARSKDVSVSS